MVFGDPEKQAFKTMENMEVMLDAAGMGFQDVCKVVCYLENVRDRPQINVARKHFFGDSRPCSTLFGVRRLAIPGMNHEIEAIAYKPRDGAPPRTEIRAPGIHEPISHYTDAVQAGDFLFVSGQSPFDDALGLPGDTMAAQATQMHDNLQRIMAEAGFGFDDVAKVTAYLDDCDERPELNAVRRKYFGPHRPASTMKVERIIGRQAGFALRRHESAKVDGDLSTDPTGRRRTPVARRLPRRRCRPQRDGFRAPLR